MQHTALSHTAAVSSHASPFANMAAGTFHVAHRAAAPARAVTAADLLSIAIGFEETANEIGIEPTALETEQLAAVAQITWAQYHEVGKILARSVRALRNRMSPGQYTQLLETMPGFLI